MPERSPDSRGQVANPPPPRLPLTPRLAGALVALAGLLGAFALSHWEGRRRDHRRREVLEAIAAGEARRATRTLTLRARALARMASRWIHGTEPTWTRWERDAHAYLEGGDGFRWLRWHPEEGTPRALGQGAAEDVLEQLPVVYELDEASEEVRLRVDLSPRGDPGGVIEAGLRLGQLVGGESSDSSSLGAGQRRVEVVTQGGPTPLSPSEMAAEAPLRIGSSEVLVCARGPRGFALGGYPFDMAIGTVGAGVAALLGLLTALALELWGQRENLEAIVLGRTEELRTLNEELEARVEARTRELHQKNAELESFNYSVSHDLRAPLRAMEGFSRILVEDHGEELDGEAAELLGRIRVNSVQMKEMIEDLLELSRVGRAELARAPIDLTAEAREVLEELRQAEPEREVTVEIEEGLRVEADRRLARQLLVNLLGNAWKFTAGVEGARIRVGRAEDGGFVVEDNGAGFDPAFQEKMWRVFERLHPERDFPGSGVGLALVRRIVERHDGEVSASGTPGEGARFQFHLGLRAPDPVPGAGAGVAPA